MVFRYDARFSHRIYNALPFVVVGIIAASTYILSVSSEPASWDNAEMQTVPYVMGIAHPTGFPLYVLAGYVFSHVVPIGTVAFRLNIFSALCMAGALVAVVATARVLDIPTAFAAPAVLWLGFTTLIWARATRADVHDLELLCLVTSLAFLLAWAKTREQRWFLCAAGAWACAIATHPVAIWVVPAFALAVFFSRKSLDVRQGMVALGIASLGLALYAYIPLRSEFIVREHLDPTMNLAGAKGAIMLNTDDTRIPAHFIRYVSGSDFGVTNALLKSFAPSAVQAHLWSLFTTVNMYGGSFALIFAGLGAYRLWARNWQLFSVVTLFCFAAVPFADVYSAVEGDPDRYRMLAMVGATLFIAASGGNWPIRTSGTLTLAFLISAATAQFTANRGFILAPPDLGPRRMIDSVGAHVPTGSIVVTSWLDATSLAYGNLVDGTFPNRIVISSSPGEYEADYKSWARRYPIYVISNQLMRRPFIATGVIDGQHIVYRYGD